MKIGILSDTHGFLDPAIINYFEECDQVWHLGDIGSLTVLEELEEKFDVKAVYGNIDDHIVRRATDEFLIFDCEGFKILLIHIGGYPGRYNVKTKELILEHQPDIYLCGHSHILKIMRDKKNNLLHINPGACGVHGFHKVRTLVRFKLENKIISNMEVIELGQRG